MRKKLLLITPGWDQLWKPNCWSCELYYSVTLWLLSTCSPQLLLQSKDTKQLWPESKCLHLQETAADFTKQIVCKYRG